MKKVSIILGVLLFMCLALLPMEAQAAETEGYLTYTITDGEATITDCDEDASGKIVIPDTIEGYPVTKILGYTFSQCDSITSVTVPSGVTQIGTLQCVAPVWVDENNPYLTSDSQGAVYSKDMKTLVGVPASLTGVYTVPEGVQTIESRAFATCEKLTQIILPESVTVIKAGAFAWCTKLESINIPAGVKDLGGVSGYMFIKCSSLKSIAIPEGVTAIPESTFMECTSLESVELPHTVTFIGLEAFLECTSLKTIDLSHVTEIEESAFQMCTSLSGKLVLAEGLTRIDIAVFANCFNLEEVVLPESLTEIGSGAFFGCNSLKELYIPAGVTSFGENSDVQMAFRVAEDNPNYTSDSYGVLYTKDMQTLIGAPRELSGHYTIPDGVTELSYRAFCGCKGLTGVDVPDSLTTIGSYAFSDSGLTEVPAFENVTVLNATFRGCNSLTSAVIPYGVQTLQSYAFSDCENLTQVVIPNSVKTLGWRVFEDSSNLSTVIFCGTESEWNRIEIGQFNEDILNAQLRFHILGEREILREPTCANDGLATYSCTICNAYKSETIPRGGEHDFRKEWSCNETDHWHRCIRCSERTDMEVHIPGPAATTESAQYCTSCGYELAPILSAGTEEPPAADGEEQENEFIIWIIVGAVVLIAGGVTVFIIVKKKRQ